MLGTKLNPRSFLERIGQELLRIDPGEVKALADAIYECYQRRRMVFLCGNGGSGSNASHFCEDLGKGTLRREDFD
ncbi:MAG: SIS domain-containing protein, partial [Planctomycetes bacterium]|nr:SIS domain-containing protein [Planctomycetota bacterium]